MPLYSGRQLFFSKGKSIHRSVWNGEFLSSVLCVKVGSLTNNNKGVSLSSYYLNINLIIVKFISNLHFKWPSCVGVVSLTCITDGRLRGGDGDSSLYIVFITKTWSWLWRALPSTLTTFINIKEYQVAVTLMVAEKSVKATFAEL